MARHHSGVSLATLVRFEWRILAADRALWIAAVVFSVLLGYGISNGLAWTASQHAVHQGARDDEERRWNKLSQELDRLPADAPIRGPFEYDPRRPHLIGAVAGARYATLTPTALTPLAVGQSDLYPSYYKVTSRSRLTFLDADEIENPGNLLAGRFDVAFVVVYLFPLLILALSFNLLAAEREAGTLGLVLSHPVPLSRLLWAKVLARGSILGSIAVGLAVAGVAVSGEVWNRATPALFLLWIAVVLSYGTIWFGLALLVNLSRRNAATCALMLAGLWLGLVLLIPTSLNVLINARYPVPSRVELITAMRTASNEASARGSALLARYFEDHPELGRANDSAALNDFQARSYLVARSVDSAVQPVLARFDRQLQGQQRLVDRFRFASPALLAQDALSDLSGTGPARYRAFRSQVERFHSAWAAFFVPRILAQQLVDLDQLRRAPTWQWHEESASDVARRVALPLTALLLVALGLFLWAARQASRYRPVG